MLADIKITDATSKDIPALVALLDELFSIEQDFQPNPARQIAGLQLLLNTAKNAVIKVAKNIEGEVIGMVSGQLVISTSQGSPSVWIEDMVVSEKYRACGVGRTLLEAALEWAKGHGATRAQLLVDLDNTIAIGYYDHLGWQPSRMGMRRLLL
jgi:ribosomal protein S18 acetylase RimI-like enzyme